MPFTHVPVYVSYPTVALRTQLLHCSEVLCNLEDDQVIIVAGCSLPVVSTELPRPFLLICWEVVLPAWTLELKAQPVKVAVVIEHQQVALPSGVTLLP
mgnify:CR=1 FL=1